MRIKEEIRRSGYFWSPDEPDTKLPGTLSIFDGGIIELELLQAQDSEKLDLKEIWTRVVGQIEKEGFVKLDYCKLKKAENLGGWISKFRYNVKRAITSLTYQNSEYPRFTSLSFSVEGLDDWVGLNEITIDGLLHREGTINLSYNQPEHVAINLENGMQLFIMSTFTCPGRFSFNDDGTLNQKADEFNIRPVTSITLFAPDGCGFEEFHPVVKELTAFLCFATNRFVCIDSMSAEIGNPNSDITGGTTSMDTAKIYYESWPYANYTNDKSKIPPPNSIEFSALSDHGEKIVKQWIAVYDQIEFGLNLYLSARMGAHPTSQARYLALAQALEGCHRRACGNSKSFGERIGHIIEPYAKIIGDEATQQELISKIVKTRNYLTHNDLSLEPKAAKGVELHHLCSKMERLFQLYILQLLGFNQPFSDLHQSLVFIFSKPESQVPSAGCTLD